MVFSAINQKCQDYWDQLPNDILPAVSKSAFYTFTVALLFSARKADGAYDLTRPVMKAGVAALASTLHAIATPLFNKVFGTRQLDPIHEIAKSSVIAFAASAIVGLADSSSLALSSFKLYYLISGNSFDAWTNSQGNRPHIQSNSLYMCF